LCLWATGKKQVFISVTAVYNDLLIKNDATYDVAQTMFYKYPDTDYWI